METYDVIVIGGGQAGLSVGHHLARTGLSHAILDAEDRIGDAWRKRWDSLRLFTPARYDGLDGMPFPAPPHVFPTKDEMADYLEAYAEQQRLPVWTRTRVERLARAGDGWLAETSRGPIRADQVIVAMANFQKPRVPPFAGDLDPGIVQLHGMAYRNPAQLRAGAVLVVGAGNSGAEIALELSRRQPVLLSGRPVGQLPFRSDGRLARHLLLPILFRLVFHRLLTVDTRAGRRMRERSLAHGTPLIRTREPELAVAGVRRVARMVGARDGRPVLADGSSPDVTNVVWCTGSGPDYSWIDLPIFDARGLPRHERGVVREAPGLYFVGLHFTSAMSSSMVHGVGRDAARVVGVCASRA